MTMHVLQQQYRTSVINNPVPESGTFYLHLLYHIDIFHWSDSWKGKNNEKDINNNITYNFWCNNT